MVFINNVRDSLDLVIADANNGIKTEENGDDDESYRIILKTGIEGITYWLNLWQFGFGINENNPSRVKLYRKHPNESGYGACIASFGLESNGGIKLGTIATIVARIIEDFE